MYSLLPVVKKKKGFASNICWERTYVPEQSDSKKRFQPEHAMGSVHIQRDGLAVHTVGTYVLSTE